MSMLAVRVAKRQWATTAEPGIFSQIVMCLFASGYLRYIVLQYVGPDTWRIWYAMVLKKQGSHGIINKLMHVRFLKSYF